MSMGDDEATREGASSWNTLKDQDQLICEEEGYLQVKKIGIAYVLING